MRVAITDKGNAYAVPPEWPGEPRYIYCIDDEIVYCWGDVAGWALGAEKVERIADWPDKATHYNSLYGRPATLSINTAPVLEECCPWMKPIIGRVPTIDPAWRDRGCLKPEDWTPTPPGIPDWVTHATGALLALLIFVGVLHVAANLDLWPLWVCLALLTLLAGGLLALGGIIAIMREGREGS